MSSLSLEIGYALKKVRNIAAYLGLLLAVSCNNVEHQPRSNLKVVTTPAAQVNSTFRVKDGSDRAALLTELYNNKNCREFFNAFPNTFDEFDQLYGFDDDKGERILYSKSEEHISFLYGCAEVSDFEKLKKSIDIGINGRWEADASALVQSFAFNLIKDNPNETKAILDTLPNSKASSFWYFMFDGPHPTDQENIKKVDLLRNLLGKDSKQSKLLSEQYKKLLVDWSEH